jgi:Transposase DDE domain
VASGKVARRAVGSEISALLDSTEIAALIGEIDAAGDARGRKGYGTRALVGACLVKALHGLPTWTRVASLIEDHPVLQAALGGTPSLWACYRFTTKLRLHSDKLADCLDRIAASLQDAIPGIGGEIAIDGTDLAAFANGQKYLWRDGPERKRYSDPDASWGHRSAVSTRNGGGYYGYKLHAAVCVQTGLPLAWRAETAKHSESLFVASLLDAVQARGYTPQTCAMDKGYDHERIHGECETRNVHPVIPIRKHHERMGLPTAPLGTRHNPHISRYGNDFRNLYYRRSAVEREFGNLKHHFGLAPLRVRGLERVQLHADLTILARLSLALSRARAMPLAA